MDIIEWISQPELRDPVAIVAFEGWNDAAEAASGALWHLLEKHDSLELAVIDHEEFADFQVTRPTVQVVDGEREIRWPHTKAWAISSIGSRDVVVVLGDEPRLRWRAFSREVTALLTALGVSEVLSLGAFLGQVAHTLPVPIIGVTDNASLQARLGLLPSTYEGPTGIIGVLNEAFKTGGMRAWSLWAATPHYLSGSNNPKASQALLEKASRLLDIDLDAESLNRDVGEWEQRIAAVVSDSDELTDYLVELEEAAPMLADEGGEQLVEEIEQFLRDPEQ
ncbi:MAG: PAC2 family protein [Acidimicrobiia bacterium]|nr:PAC2 family protein [Acidimicrobiia bacterium]